MRELCVSLIFSAIVLATIFGFMARAQRCEDVNADNGITLADLGVREAQKTDIKALWQLKRQNQIQALKDLKTFNRLAKDPDALEETLVETVPARAQLHLTILGVLENGLARHIGGTRTQRARESSNKRDDKGRESRKR